VGHDGWTNEDFFSYTAGYWGIFPIILLEIFLLLCFGRKSPSGIRDQMFRFFMGAKAIGHYRLQMPEQQKLAKSHNARRVGLAQAGALAFYFLALLVYALCIPLFIFVMAYSEHALNFFPDAEEVYEPGQWLPWVGKLGARSHKRLSFVNIEQLSYSSSALLLLDVITMSGGRMLSTCSSERRSRLALCIRLAVGQGEILSVNTSHGRRGAYVDGWIWNCAT